VDDDRFATGKVHSSDATADTTLIRVPPFLRLLGL